MVCEFFYRTYHKLFRGIPYSQSVKSDADKELGWKCKTIFGDVSSKKFKIMIVGDSFTHGQGIEEKDMYYKVIRDTFGGELFVFGGGGYGTLQEYMVLRKFINLIRPDLVILQVCSNDFINNSWKLESKSYFNNNSRIRPYWIGNKIVYRFPRPLDHLRVFLSQSRLFYALFVQADRFTARLAQKGFLVRSVEQDIQDPRRVPHPDFLESVKITNELIKKIKSTAGDIPVIAFSVNATEPYKQKFKEIFIEHDIEFLTDVPEAIQRVEATGVNARIADRTHWNAIGHKICGETLTQDLIKLGYIPDKQP